MGPDKLVEVPPFINAPSSTRRILEPVFIQTVVTNRTVEAFDKWILHRLTKLNETQLGSGLQTSEEQDFASESAAVGADNAFSQRNGSLNSSFGSGVGRSACQTQPTCKQCQPADRSDRAKAANVS